MKIHRNEQGHVIRECENGRRLYLGTATTDEALDEIRKAHETGDLPGVELPREFPGAGPDPFHPGAGFGGRPNVGTTPGAVHPSLPGALHGTREVAVGMSLDLIERVKSLSTQALTGEYEDVLVALEDVKHAAVRYDAVLRQLVIK